MSLQKLAEDFQVIKTEMMKKGEDALRVEFNKVFELYPEITAIGWTQYTPYFNDGDTCTFRVGSMIVTNAKDLDEVNFSSEEFEGDDEDGLTFVSSLWGDFRGKYPAIDDLETFLGTDIGEDIALSIFGDHATVTITRESIEVSEYEHE